MQNIQQVCFLPHALVQGTIQSYRTVPCSHLPAHLADNDSQ